MGTTMDRVVRARLDQTVSRLSSNSAMCTANPSMYADYQARAGALDVVTKMDGIEDQQAYVDSVDRMVRSATRDKRLACTNENLMRIAQDVNMFGNLMVRMEKNYATLCAELDTDASKSGMLLCNYFWQNDMSLRDATEIHDLALQLFAPKQNAREVCLEYFNAEKKELERQADELEARSFELAEGASLLRARLEIMKMSEPTELPRLFFCGRDLGLYENNELLLHAGIHTTLRVHPNMRLMFSEKKIGDLDGYTKFIRTGKALEGVFYEGGNVQFIEFVPPRKIKNLYAVDAHSWEMTQLFAGLSITIFDGKTALSRKRSLWAERMLRDTATSE